MKTELRDVILSRCVEVGECVEWQGGLNSGGHPIMTWAGKGGQLVRRLLAGSMEREIREGHVLRMRCMNRRCINPEHTVVSTRQKVGMEAGKAGRLSSPTKGLRCHIARAKWAKLDISKVAEIRASTDTDKVLAERYSVSLKTINDARRGLSWKATLPMGMGALR